MKIYHYSHFDYWRDIKRGSWKSKEKPGLGAHRRMGREDTEAWEAGAVFALLEPLPDNWVKNEHFEGVWDYLRNDMGTLLLELEVDPEKDKVFVVDRGHVEGFLYDDKKGIPERYLHSTRREGERAYMESKIPLRDYLSRAKELGYSMPEVIVLEDVPLERIKVSERQPLIEEELREYRGEYRRRRIRDIREIPELARWYEQHESELRKMEEGGERLRRR
ncbi:MAG: hypothetical protein WC348_00715 [Patescibacteria group bacterium]|jgi:hypothetical protein